MDKNAELEETLVLVGFLRQRTVNLRKELESSREELKQVKEERDGLFVQLNNKEEGA